MCLCNEENRIENLRTKYAGQSFHTQYITHDSWILFWREKLLLIGLVGNWGTFSRHSFYCVLIDIITVTSPMINHEFN